MRTEYQAAQQNGSSREQALWSWCKMVETDGLRLILFALVSPFQRGTELLQVRVDCPIHLSVTLAPVVAAQCVVATDSNQTGHEEHQR